jgi:anti-anti-sigma factor
MHLDKRNRIAPGRTKGGLTAAGNEGAQGPSEPAAGFGISRAGGTVIVTIRGAIDSDVWERINAVLRDLIDAQGNLDVVVDLSEMVRLDEDAVPLIVGAARQAHSHGGRLRLADTACREHWRASDS